MSEGRSSVSQAKSYREIAEFWDTHDLADQWDQTEPVKFEVDVQSEATYYALERRLSHKLARAADEREVSPGTPQYSDAGKAHRRSETKALTPFSR